MSLYFKTRMNEIVCRNKELIIKLIPVTIAFLLAFNSTNSYSQDLLSGTDMQDSPLTLSLATIVPMAIENQVQQIVISQYGILNKATVNQMANAANLVDISQNGFNNSVDIIQSGYGNSVHLQQLGDNNLAEIVQEGDANIVNITQVGEQTFIVHQIGNEMVVNITQY